MPGYVRATTQLIYLPLSEEKGDRQERGPCGPFPVSKFGERADGGSQISYFNFSDCASRNIVSDDAFGERM